MKSLINYLHLSFLVALFSCNQNKILKLSNEKNVLEDKVVLKSVPLSLHFVNDSSIVFSVKNTIYSLNPQTGTVSIVYDLAKNVSTNQILYAVVKIDTNSSLLKQIEEMKIKNLKPTIQLSNETVSKDGEIYIMANISYPVAQKSKPEDDGKLNIAIDFSKFLIKINPIKKQSTIMPLSLYMDTLNKTSDVPLTSFFVIDTTAYVGRFSNNIMKDYSYSILSKYNLKTFAFQGEVPIFINSKLDPSEAQDSMRSFAMFTSIESNGNYFIEDEKSVYNLSTSKIIFSIKDFIKEPATITFFSPKNKDQSKWIVEYKLSNSDQFNLVEIDLAKRTLIDIKNEYKNFVWINDPTKGTLYSISLEDANYKITTYNY